MVGKSEETTRDESTSLDDLEAELARLRKDFTSLADTITDIAAGEYRAAKQDVNGAAANARKTAAEAAAQLRPAVEKNPLISLLLAFGIGFLIGAILRR